MSMKRVCAHHASEAGKLLKERLEHYGYTAANLPQAHRVQFAVLGKRT